MLSHWNVQLQFEKKPTAFVQEKSALLPRQCWDAHMRHRHIL